MVLDGTGFVIGESGFVISGFRLNVGAA